MSEIISVADDLIVLVNKWEHIFKKLPEETYSGRRNSQGRTIKMILGHLIDSATNNTHRIVHLQYQQSPLVFPNYATMGNNDRWIAIQNYNDEEWVILVQLWKYAYLHISHVIKNVNEEMLKNEWLSGPDEKVTLEAMIIDFPSHLKLHLLEIVQLIGGN